MAGMSWTALVNAAVMGTGRTADSPAAVLAEIGLAPADHQQRMLVGAAAMSRARRAGYRPPEAGERTAPAGAEPDSRPEVAPAAERRLAQLLGAADYELVGEWFRCLTALDHPRRPPDVLVPELLTAASGHPRLRASMLRALGPLAGWLAGFNAEWSWARERGAGASAARTGEPALSASDQWETAGIDDRRALLGRLRESDPAAGRELVAATWAVDSYRDRAAFLAMLSVGLSCGDEPLAEQALGDRRAEVRRIAADLLARLPGSRHSRRAVARAASAVRIERKGRRQRLVVTAPETVTQEMVADGVDGSPPRGTGTGAWLLQQLVAAAPSAFWAAHTGLDPGELLDLGDRTDWSAPLRVGWRAAAIRDGDRDWLLALLNQPGPEVTANLRLVTSLDADTRDAWLRSNPGSSLFDAALEVIPAPWSVPLSDLVRRRLGVVARADPGYSPAPRRLFRLAARRLEPPEPPDLDPGAVHDRLGDSWDDLVNTLSVRAAMRRELTEEPRK
jgi:Family of unknown function (DUF5691)